MEQPPVRRFRLGSLSRSSASTPAKPWGRVIPEPWESLRDRLLERRQKMSEIIDPGRHLQFSEFKGEYVRPEYAGLYNSFIKLNAKTGLLERDKQVFRPFFTIYSQPKQGGGWIINIPEFDFDLLEKDFARMKQASINVQPRFWNWSELLNPDGTWKAVVEQPDGDTLPYFKYVYEIYDYFLDQGAGARSLRQHRAVVLLGPAPRCRPDALPRQDHAP